MSVIGTRFSRLTIIEEPYTALAEKGYRHTRVLVKCDCGNTKDVVLGSLKQGLTKSCGCLHKETSARNGKLYSVGNGNKLDLTGKVFHRLTVDGLAYMKAGSSYWNVTCECGTKKVAKGALLNFGKLKSCGCLMLESGKENGKRNKGRVIQERRDATREKHIGLKFNKLTIIDTISLPYGGPNAICRCDCGGEKIAKISDVISGRVMTCGCSRAGTSRPEEDLRDFILAIDPDAEHDVSISGRLRFDVLSKKHGIAFEMNGIYWHSGKFHSRSYHIQKRRLAEDAGYQLMTIWQDDWSNNREKIERLIKRRMGIAENKAVYAKRVNVCNIGQTEANAFHDQHHIQGGRLFGCVSFAAQIGEQVIAVATFKKNVLVRYTVADGVSFVGGLGKLVKASGLEKVITYADRDYFEGTVYTSGGFEKTGTTLRMTYFYKTERFNRERFMKHKLKDLGIEVLNGDTEESALARVGIYPCYNSGIDRYEWRQTTL